MKAIKGITAIFLLIVGLLVVSSAALAAISETRFDVEVNDEELTEGGSPLYVERGEEIEIEVKFEYDFDPATEDLDDLRVKAWLGGYEYEDDVEVVTDMFDYKTPGMLKKEKLTLQLPNDMDNSEEYFLHIELYNHDYVSQHKYNLKVEAERHRLDIQDIMLMPSTVTAGNALFATVRVENMGDNKEEDIRVTVRIPELGVSTRTYIDELVAEEDDEDDVETSESSEEMMLIIPEDAKTGDYTVEVVLDYNRGHDTIIEKELIHIKAGEVEEVEEVPKTIISVDSTSKEVIAGIESAFKVMVANLGEETAVYSIEVTGTDLWATARVEPGMVTLIPDSTGEMYVYVKPKTDAEEGQHSFTFKVKSGNQIVSEKTLTADVSGTTASTTTTTTEETTTEETNGETNFASLKNALVIGFGVLVVLLVILGLIIAFNKMNKDEDEEIPTSEGQAYY